eukprot:gene8273-11200_t
MGHSLKYYPDSSSYEKKPHECSGEYDICDIKSIEKGNNKTFTLYFLNGKFKLELKSISDEVCNEWCEVLLAKKSLYSIDELLLDLNQQNIVFQTTTFQSLLILKEKEQNKWILDRLDESFQIIQRNSLELKDQISLALIKAAKTSIEEFIVICKECLIELNGRIILELSFIPGLLEKKFELMGESTICASIELIAAIDSLRLFNFIQPDVIRVLNDSLFTIGQLISSIINLSIHRLDAFFEMTIHPSVPPLQRSMKLIDIEMVIQEFIKSISINLDDDYMILKIILSKVITSQILGFSDQLMSIDFSSYDEIALVKHISSCDSIIKKFEGLKVRLNDRKLISKNNTNNMINTNKSTSDDVDDTQTVYMIISTDVIDSLISSCYGSSKQASKQAIYNMSLNIKSILDGVLNENNGDWISGAIIQAYVYRLDSWATEFVLTVPNRFSILIFIETTRLVISTYLQTIVHYYQRHKNIKLTERGILQFERDLNIINEWMDQSAEKTSTSMIYNNPNNFNKLSSSKYEQKQQHISNFLQEVQVEKNLLLTVCKFLHFNHSNALEYYAESVLVFGLQYSFHLYDIIRLIMKFRIDILPTNRRLILALCSEYLMKLSEAVVLDPLLSEGTHKSHSGYLEISIFDLLCPRVGMEHCTGKKWALEKHPNPLSIQLEIINLVTKTCNEARKTRRNQSIKSESDVLTEDDIQVYEKTMPRPNNNNINNNVTQQTQVDIVVSASKNPFGDDDYEDNDDNDDNVLNHENINEESSQLAYNNNNYKSDNNNDNNNIASDNINLNIEESNSTEAGLSIKNMNLDIRSAVEVIQPTLPPKTIRENPNKPTNPINNSSNIKSKNPFNPFNDDMEETTITTSKKSYASSNPFDDDFVSNVESEKSSKNPFADDFESEISLNSSTNNTNRQPPPKSMKPKPKLPNDSNNNSKVPSASLVSNEYDDGSIPLATQVSVINKPAKSAKINIVNEEANDT